MPFVSFSLRISGVYAGFGQDGKSPAIRGTTVEIEIDVSR
jgi:hypothetical protein